MTTFSPQTHPSNAESEDNSLPRVKLPENPFARQFHIETPRRVEDLVAGSPMAIRNALESVINETESAPTPEFMPKPVEATPAAVPMPETPATSGPRPFEGLQPARPYVAENRNAPPAAPPQPVLATELAPLAAPPQPAAPQLENIFEGSASHTDSAMQFPTADLPRSSAPATNALPQQPQQSLPAEVATALTSPQAWFSAPKDELLQFSSNAAATEQFDPVAIAAMVDRATTSAPDAPATQDTTAKSGGALRLALMIGLPAAGGVGIAIAANTLLS